MKVETQVPWDSKVDHAANSKQSGQTSHINYFGPLGVGSRVTPAGSLQTIAHSNGWYGCVKIGHDVRYCRKSPMQFSKCRPKYEKCR